MKKLDLALIEATRNNETSKVISLLEQGANPNYCEKFVSRGYINAFRFPLHIACRCANRNGYGLVFFDNSEIVAALLDFGADIECKNEDDFTPLRWASVEPKFESCKVLIGRGADVNATDCQGTTPLMIASFRTNQELIELLLTNGANINHQNNFGATALMYSLNHIYIDGQIETVKRLLENGADLNLKDKKGDTILSSLSRRKEIPEVKEVIDLLEKYVFKE